MSQAESVGHGSIKKLPSNLAPAGTRHAGVVVVSLLVAKGYIPAYPIAVIVIGALFVSNFLMAWLIRAKQRGTSGSSSRVRLRFLVSVAIFTVAGVVVIVDFLAHPSLPRGLQAGFAILFLSLLWFIAYRLHRGPSR